MSMQEVGSWLGTGYSGRRFDQKYTISSVNPLARTLFMYAKRPDEHVPAASSSSDSPLICPTNISETKNST